MPEVGPLRWAIVARRVGPRRPATRLSRLVVRVPPASLHSRPSAAGISCVASVTAASQALADPWKRAANSGLRSSMRRRLRRVPRTTNSPRTRHVPPSSGPEDRRAARALVFASRPRRPAPTSSNQFQTSTTTASRVARRTSAMSMERDRAAVGSIASSGSATQLPARASSTTALWRRRCSISRGWSAPGARSRNTTSCSPTAAARQANVSTPVLDPSPRSISLIRACETPLRAASSCWVSPAIWRASRRPTPSRRDSVTARDRPAITAGVARSLRLLACISTTALPVAFGADLSACRAPLFHCPRAVQARLPHRTCGCSGAAGRNPAG